MTIRSVTACLSGLRDWDAALVFCVLCITGVVAGESYRQLKGPQIAARLSGQELTDGIHWGLVFAKGGRLLSNERGGPMASGDREPNTGSWHIKGDEVCFTFADSDPRCHAVWVLHRNLQLRGPGGETIDGILQKPETPPESTRTIGEHR